jgi:hypothetical protein
MSAYRTAIDRTAAAVDRRARYFRNQIVVVVTIGIATGVLAIATRAAASLWGGLLLVPACGFFFYIDARVLNEWRTQVLTPWTERSLDLLAWSAAVRANPVLPKATTEAMLTTLPLAEDLTAEQKLQPSTRRALAAACAAVNSAKADELLIKAIASALIVIVVLTAIAARSWVPLAALALLALVPLARGWSRRRHGARCDADVARCRNETGFNETEYSTLVARLR